MNETEQCRRRITCDGFPVLLLHRVEIGSGHTHSGWCFMGITVGKAVGSDSWLLFYIDGIEIMEIQHTNS
jgi:hypothetical protein